MQHGPTVVSCKMWFRVCLDVDIQGHVIELDSIISLGIKIGHDSNSVVWMTIQLASDEILERGAGCEEKEKAR